MNRIVTMLGYLFVVGLALTANPVLSQERHLRKAVEVKVDWEDGKTFSFQEVSGLGMQVEILEFREGGDPAAVRKLPGRVNYPNVILKRGFVGGDDFWDWIKSARSGSLTRKNLLITLIDSQGATLAKFRLAQCLPSRWTVETDTPHERRIFVEQVEIATEQVDIVP